MSPPRQRLGSWLGTAWIAALDRLAALMPGAVVAGHKDPTEGNPPALLAESRGYLEYYGQLREAGLPNQDLFEAVVSHYPHRVRRQQFLILGSCESWYRPL